MCDLIVKFPYNASLKQFFLLFVQGVYVVTDQLKPLIKLKVAEHVG